MADDEATRELAQTRELAASQFARLCKLASENEDLRTRLAEASKVWDGPETADWVEGVRKEAAHQVARWGPGHDATKEPEEWFWLLGYLAGKALAAAKAGDLEKALHHTISSGAALANWHRALAAQELDEGSYAEFVAQRIQSRPSASEELAALGNDKLRGYEIHWDGDVWRYTDTGEPTVGTHRERDCGYCNRRTGEDGHDPCLGTLPGVVNACCGHGNPDEAYVQLRSGETLRGEPACEFFVVNKGTPAFLPPKQPPPTTPVPPIDGDP